MQLVRLLSFWPHLFIFFPFCGIVVKPKLVIFVLFLRSFLSFSFFFFFCTCALDEYEMENLVEFLVHKGNAMQLHFSKMTRLG